MSFHLRTLTAHDLTALLNLQQTAYPVLSESADAIASRLQQAGWCWGAEKNGELAAYLLTHPWPYEAPPAWNQILTSPLDTQGYFYIHDLALAASARGQGIAQQLIANAFETAQRKGLTQTRLIAVQNSQGFWAKQGFITITPNPQLREKLHSYGDEACLMQRGS